MKIHANIINAFIDGDMGGNPAGIVLNSDKFEIHQKQEIANKMGLSETAFISSSDIAGFKLDFFTPTRQIAHCGHATIAAFSYLSQNGLVKDGWTSKETIDGNRKILIQGDYAYMEQQKPRYTDIQKYHNTIFDSLNISKEELISLPELVNTGNSFVIIGVENETILSKIIPDSKLINDVSEELDLIGYYIYALYKGNQERDAKTRMFAPRYGIQEEAATGMAAGPLACFLYDKQQIKKKEFNIEQGYLMENPSPSIINVKLEIENQNIVSLMAGGRGKIMKEKMISI